MSFSFRLGRGRTIVAGITTPVVLAAVAIGIGIAGPAKATSGTLSGSNGGGVPSVAAAFGTFRGAPDTVMNSYMPHSTWAEMANPGWGGPDNWKGQNIQASWAVTMLPTSGGSIQTGATGAYNQYFVSMAQKLVADGEGNAIIRLGWEMNGNWYSWSGQQDPTSWIAYWRQIVTAMRGVSGAHFLFDWSPSDGVYYDASLLYPGDAYVDMVGMSVYDQSWTYSTSQITQRWNEIYNGLPGEQGLAWLTSFATAHNKPMGFGEWGLTQRCDGHGGNDDPYFIQQMHTFFANNNVAFEAYFDIDPSSDPTSCEYHSMTAGHFPVATALYKQLFSQPYAPVAVPTTTANAATSSTVVRLSTSSDRSNPMALDGASLHGAAYIWAQTSVANFKSASFYLDTPVTGTPTHVETTLPYDFVGGTTTAATAFNSDTLTPGTHTMNVVILTSSGSTTYTSTFTTGSTATATPSAAPSSAPVTTAPASSAAPTTAAPTTAAPTTVAPTTAAPTTAAPTTVAPPTSAPATVAPTPPPAPTVALTGRQDSNGTYTADVTATVGVPGSLSAHVVTSSTGLTYSLDGAAAQPFTAPLVVTTDGSHSLVVTATVAGLSASTTQTWTEKHDTTPPVATISLAGTQRPSAGAYLTDVTATVAASDDVAVASTTYSLDGGPATPYTTPVVVHADGSHTLVVTSTDTSGNVGTATQTWTEQHDTTAPIATIALAGTQRPTAGAFLTDVTATVAATDDVAVASTTYSLDGGPATPYTTPVVVHADGSHTLVVTSTDTSGNVGTATQSWTEQHDTTPPVASVSLAGLQDVNGNYTGTVTATVNATDDVAVASTTYSLDGGPATPYTTPVAVTADGNHSLVVTATDTSGNVGTKTTTWTAHLDTTPPVAFVSLAGLQDVRGNFTGPVTATVIAADNIAVVSTTYSLDGGPATPYTTPVVVPTDGNHSLTVTATDPSGNVGTATSTWTTHLDVTPPTMSVGLAGTQGVSGAYSTDVTASVAATDDVAVASLTYSLDGGPVTPYTAPILVTTDGTHLLNITATDPSGNVATGSQTWTEQHVVGLFASNSASRANAVSLNGAALAGNSYIYASAPASARTVAFTLDGIPTRLEVSAPWDLSGTGAAGALPLDTNTLGGGTHTLTATTVTATGSTIVTTSTFTVANPATSPLRVSTNADRSAAVNLDGARLSGIVYVFDVPVQAAYAVNFLLDGKPFHLEVTAPYDLGSSGPVNALPVDFSRLAKGKHTVSAVVAKVSGGTTTTTATFTIL